ncbi:proteasome activator complex subunit 4-like isoform X1 [Bombus pascuorum]|uniref:proteasome activator complex subunit 4-like isoform X1 n=1 Tax=Bombus pascuorum TaxID=65598 RepID=UPI0021230B34|nr:proteasome activator complex subunit 4-like isoform X1 [Bombus pascuorum]
MNKNLTNICIYKSIDDVQSKKFIYNKLLPYADEVETETQALFAEIKANLGRAVMFNEIWPGCYVWVNKLGHYINMYGFNFSKEDHILLIKLLYELVTVSEIPTASTFQCLVALLVLLKKKKYISPDELELPWRPLYNMILRIMKAKENRPEMYHICHLFENTTESLIVYAKVYFPLSATQEILDELRPTLCLTDVITMSESIQLLRWFLPVQLPPKYHSIGYQLWFEEFMKLWEICHNAPTWENKMMELMAAVANYNIGYINWEPYIPLMFTRFIRCLKLPVSSNKLQRHHEIDASSITIWIVAVLGNGSSAQTYLDKFLKTIETYFHPANNGYWLNILKEILMKLSFYFITRLHKERYAEPTWETPIPEEYKLTDNHVDAFVKSMLPVTMASIFNKLSVNHASQALQYLATMRPNLVIPYVLDRVSSTLDSLTIESYKLIATLNCMEAIARPMAEGSKNVNTDYTYPEGPRHILPLLSLLLSSIDPNNPEKCFLAFRLISVYACFIPIVDTSKPITTINEEDRLDYETASGFEDFVLQFLDKIFSFIDHSSLELVRLENSAGGEKSKLEKVTETVLYNVCMILLMYINDAIFKKALDKLCIFITERTLEIKVAGQLAAGLCRVFAQVNGKETLRTLLPVLSQTILDITGESNDIIKEEHVDDRLLYAMLLLSATVTTTGNNLLPYIDTLTTVLDRVVILNSREGNNLACILLRSVLHSLSTMVPYHFTSTDEIKYWGQVLDINSLNVKWYIPDEKEMAAINRIFLRYLIPETNKLKTYCKRLITLRREELLTSLNIVSTIIEGCESVLPIYEGKPLDLVKSSLKWQPFRPTLGMKHEILMPNGSNVKRYIGTLMNKLQSIILENTEGDTKSLFVLIKIWGYLLLGSASVSSNVVNYRNIKRAHRMMKDMLVRKKGIMGSFVLLCAEVQHKTRSYLQFFNLTEAHKKIMLKVFRLATSRYSDVRCQAQRILFRAFHHLTLSSRIIVPKLLDILRADPEADHEAYKGALNILIDSQETIIEHDWNKLRDLWTTLVLSKPCEKLSIIRLKEDVVKYISKQFTTIAITSKIPNTCLEIATALWKTNLQPTLSQPTEDEIVEGSKIAQAFNESNLASYNGLIDDLLNALLEKNLHWRHRLMAIDFIRHLVHPEQIYPPKVVRYFVGALIHDSLSERNIALRVVICMLQQQKREHPKITIDPPTSPEQNESSENQSMKFKRGQRADNAWLQYNFETRPLTAEQWDEPRFIHKPYVGYYTWPKKIEMYAPTPQQPCLDPNVRKLTDHEKEIDLFFNDLQNIKKLIKFYSLETKKDNDKFSYYKYRLFKALFRNHGIVFLKNFLPHLHELVKDKQESSQRCAAEIIAGIIKGSKHWPFNMVCEMWDSLLPVIKLALINMTPETLEDWVLCFSTAQQCRDPNRQHWLLEHLMEEIFVSESESSFIESGRLLILQTTLTEQLWRVLELLQRLLKRIEDRLLANPFENVRERLSSVLVTVFTSLRTSNNQSVPQIQDFLNKIVPKLQPLVDENATKFNNDVKNLPAHVSIVKSNDLKEIGINEEEKERAIRLLKTICKWIVDMNRPWYGLPPELYQIFPIIYQMENCETDEELKQSCTSALTIYAQAFTLPCNMPIALEAVEKMSKHVSWWTRSACLEFLQAWVFYNMCTFLSNPSWVNSVKDIVLRLLEDERVEVRKNAGELLSGLVHCMFIPELESLLDEFKKKANIKLCKKEALNSNKEETKKNLKADALRIRHAAIIGMCAFVQAHPYDIPKYVPPIFEHLRAHMNDPQPIPMTIKETLDDFKRTHNGWRGVEEYMQHFTEEQLSVLQDLIMPPSYYA